MFFLGFRTWVLFVVSGVMRKIATKLRECADLLQDKAMKLDGAHGTEQIEDVIRSLREHSEMIDELAVRIEPEDPSESSEGK